MARYALSFPSSRYSLSSLGAGWFLFHSMHSLCGIIGSCRTLLTLTLYLPSDASAWTQSLCSSLIDLKLLHTLTKDMEPSWEGASGAGRREGMDVGWRPRRSVAMWSVSQVRLGGGSCRAGELMRCAVLEAAGDAQELAYSSTVWNLVRLVDVSSDRSALLSPHRGRSHRSQARSSFSLLEDRG